MGSPNALFEKIMEEIAPLIKQYDRTVADLASSYEQTLEVRKRFLEAGIEYTRPQEKGESSSSGEQALLSAYDDYKTLLEGRVSVAKLLLSSVSSALSFVDQQLFLLDAPFDPKFGIQTQNPRIFKTNKSLSDTLAQEDGHSPSTSAESLKSARSTSTSMHSQGPERIYCTCKQPAFGDMIACDSYHIEGSWYHMDCVNVPQNPKGHWFCPKCSPPE